MGTHRLSVVCMQGGWGWVGCIVLCKGAVVNIVNCSYIYVHLGARTHTHTSSDPAYNPTTPVYEASMQSFPHAPVTPRDDKVHDFPAKC